LIQVFDSWASELSPHDFATFSLPTLVHISNRVRTALGADCVPLILFAKGVRYPLASLAREAGYDVLGLDWGVDPVLAREQVGENIVLQGNLDPGVLYGGREALERETKRMCEAFREGGGTRAWIANLGHGITPGVNPEDLRWFLECMQKYSKNA
jgi:uroporphyrinogen decarboxylase